MIIGGIVGGVVFLIIVLVVLSICIYMCCVRSLRNSNTSIPPQAYTPSSNSTSIQLPNEPMLQEPGQQYQNEAQEGAYLYPDKASYIL